MQVRPNISSWSPVCGTPYTVGTPRVLAAQILTSLFLLLFLLSLSELKTTIQIIGRRYTSSIRQATPQCVSRVPLYPSSKTVITKGPKTAASHDAVTT